MILLTDLGRGWVEVRFGLATNIVLVVDPALRFLVGVAGLEEVLFETSWSTFKGDVALTSGMSSQSMSSSFFARLSFFDILQYKIYLSFGSSKNT